MNAHSSTPFRVLLYADSNHRDAALIKNLLEKTGDTAYQVSSFTNYTEASDWVYQNRYWPPQAVVIDIPDTELHKDIDPLRLYSLIRSGGTLSGHAERFRGWSEPIVMLVRDQNFDSISSTIIEEFDKLPNGFIPKPFSPTILHTSLQGLHWNRTQAQNTEEESDVIVVDNFVLARRSRHAVVDSKIINLTPLEYAFLEYLVINRQKGTCTHEDILTAVWGIERPTTKQRTFTAEYKKLITNKFENSGYPEPIRSEYGVGYYFYTREPLAKNIPPDPYKTQPKAMNLDESKFASGYLFLVNGDEEHDYLNDVSGVLPLGNPGQAGVTVGRGYEPEDSEQIAIDRIIDSYRLKRVSRCHAFIFQNSDAHYYIHDKGSSGGTTIKRRIGDGIHPIPVPEEDEGEAVLLINGDTICFDVVEYRFQIV